MESLGNERERERVTVTGTWYKLDHILLEELRNSEKIGHVVRCFVK